jgi:protein-tyrosine phosphatase
LCKGNYFRSRFAAILFNHHAVLQGLPAAAFSRGLDFSGNNAGPVSMYVPIALKARNINYEQYRKPTRLSEPDLKRANVVIVTHAAQQLPIMNERYPHDYSDKYVCWEVADVNFTREDVAAAAQDQNRLDQYEKEALAVLEKIESHVLALISRLQEIFSNQSDISGSELVGLLSELAA